MSEGREPERDRVRAMGWRAYVAPLAMLALGVVLELFGWLGIRLPGHLHLWLSLLLILLVVSVVAPMFEAAVREWREDRRGR